MTCCYEIESVLYSTTYAKAMAPAVYSIVDLSIDPSLALSFNGAEVTDGMQMRFGYYTVKVDGGSGQYLVNGIIADGTNRLYYYGQSLTVTEATS